MSKPMISKIDQVSVVVEDAKATVNYLVEKFGIGPWAHLQFGDDGRENIRYGSIEDCVTEGDPIGTYSIDCVCCKMPNDVEIEVISPRKGSSIFARYLERHGAGAQHISLVLTGSYEETLERMAGAGFTTGQFATVIEDETCAFIEHMKSLGTYLEMHKRPDDWGAPIDDVIDLTFFPGPTPEDKPEKAPVFNQLDQINIVVEDLAASLDTMEAHYGIGPWEITENADEKKAVCASLNIRFCLIQPLNPDSADGRFLKAHGTDIRSFSAKMVSPLAQDVPVQDEGDVLRYVDNGILGVDLELIK